MIHIAQLTVPVWLILIPCPHHPGDVRAKTYHTRTACVAEATKLHLDPSACLRATEAVR
jgi:hypothetical protein